MSMLIFPPYPIFTDVDGDPLENGYIYIGVMGLNPLASPKQAYWDSALTIPASNIRTKGGYPVYNGSPGRLYVNDAYSILVQNKNGSLVYSNLNASDYVNDPNGLLVHKVNTIADLKQVLPSANGFPVQVMGYYAAGDGGGGPVRYWDAASVEADNGGSIIASSVVAPGRWKWAFDGEVNALWFGLKADGITDNRVQLQAAITTSKKLYLPRGAAAYSVVNGTGNGATLVIQRADALANNTLYPLIIDHAMELVLDGDVAFTSILGDGFKLNSSSIRISGGGSITGPGTVLDTNSADPLLQWHPSLIRITVGGNKVENIAIIDPGADGIYSEADLNTFRDLKFLGGLLVHGGGVPYPTVLMGINIAVATINNKVLNCYFGPSGSGKNLYTGVFNVGAKTIVQGCTFKGQLEHGVYNYGTDVIIANNEFYDVVAGPCQCFAENVTITGNIIVGTYGILVENAVGCKITNNKVTVSSQGAMGLRSYGTPPYTPAIIENVIISDNIITHSGVAVDCRCIDISMSQPLNRVVIANNVIKGGNCSMFIGGGGPGADLLTDCVIIGNVMEGSQDFSVYASNCSGLKIVDNLVVDGQATAGNIRPFYMLNVLGEIMGNTVRDSRTPALFKSLVTAPGTTRLSIIDNHCIGFDLLTTANPVVDPGVGSGADPGHSRNNHPDYHGCSAVITVVSAASPSRSFTDANAAMLAILRNNIKARIIPLNKAAVDLQKSVQAMYISAIGTRTITLTTSDGTNYVGGDATFVLEIDII